MTITEMKKWKDRAKKCSEIYKNAGKDLDKAKVTIPVGVFEDLVNTAIKNLETDRSIEKTLYAIREEMQCIKTAEFQMYGEYSFRFANAIESIIDRHLSELRGDTDGFN